MIVALDMLHSADTSVDTVLPQPPHVGPCRQLEISCRETPHTRGEHSDDGGQEIGQCLRNRGRGAKPLLLAAQEQPHLGADAGSLRVDRCSSILPGSDPFPLEAGQFIFRGENDRQKCNNSCKNSVLPHEQEKKGRRGNCPDTKVSRPTHSCKDHTASQDSKKMQDRTTNGEIHR